MLLLEFPTFNIYGTSLLLLTLQGALFSVLLATRGVSQSRKSDLFLAFILAITCLHEIVYTIGFMDWYDTFRTTKINYFLFDWSFALAPLIYFYVKSFINSDFQFRRKDWWHFMPIAIYVVFKAFIWIYDSNQAGFDLVQNGELMQNVEFKFTNPITFVLGIIQMVLYLNFSFQLLFQNQDKLKRNKNFNWLAIFVGVFTIQILYKVFQIVVNVSIVDLTWKQEWWLYLFSALMLVFVGVKGYFQILSNGNRLKNTNSSTPTITFAETVTLPEPEKLITEISTNSEMHFERGKTELLRMMESEQLYLNPDLNLVELARKMEMNRAELSEIINAGLEKNFNDFINELRIEHFLINVNSEEFQHLSLLGIAFESGFKSKATFNRAFKKSKGCSPSAFLKSME
jgi:AraC-like DNA-binding protein